MPRNLVNERREEVAEIRNERGRGRMDIKTYEDAITNLHKKENVKAKLMAKMKEDYKK